MATPTFLIPKFVQGSMSPNPQTVATSALPNLNPAAIKVQDPPQEWSRGHIEGWKFHGGMAYHNSDTRATSWWYTALKFWQWTNNKVTAKSQGTTLGPFGISTFPSGFGIQTKDIGPLTGQALSMNTLMEDDDWVAHSPSTPSPTPLPSHPAIQEGEDDFNAHFSILLTLSLPSSKSTFSQPSSREMYGWGSENW